MEKELGQELDDRQAEIISGGRNDMETTLWHELDEQISETISGGEQAEGCLAWSIRFGDVRRSPSIGEPIVFVIL